MMIITANAAEKSNTPKNLEKKKKIEKLEIKFLEI